MVKIISVWAMDENNVIGVKEKNEMPWRLGEYSMKQGSWWNNFKDKQSFRPIDMQHFVDLTAGSNYAVLMGRATWDSIPGFAKPLKDRDNLVLSTTMPEQEGVKVYRSFEEAQKDFEQYDQVAAMGGVSIYNLMEPLAHELHVTRLHKEFNGDIYMPFIDEKVWKLENVEPQLVGTEHEGKFSFETYVRR